MPRQNGLELYEQLIQEENLLPVVFITAHADVFKAVAAMKTDAIEFLEKPLKQENLADRLEKSMAVDQQWRASEDQLKPAASKIASLTSRERETLELIVRGHPNRAMAARLDQTERAIEMRRAKIMSKLGVHSLADLLEIVVTHRVMNEPRDLRKERYLSL